MNDNVLGASYILAIIAGIIIGFAPVSWRLGGAFFALAAFTLPLFSYIVKTSGKQSFSITDHLAFLEPAITASTYIMTGGTMSDYYLDIDPLQTDHEKARLLAYRMAERIRQATQRLGGVDRLVFIERDAGPVGAIGMQGILAIETGIDTAIVRPRRFVRGGNVKPIGVLQRDTRVVLVTDVVTGGGHIRSAIRMLQQYVDQKVFPVVPLACRERTTIDSLQREEIELYPVYEPEELADILEEHRKHKA